MCSSEPQSQMENQEKNHFFHVVGMFSSSGRDLPILDCYSRWNLVPSFWTEDKKAVHRMALSSIHPEERIQTFFISGQGYDHCLLWLCRRDSCGNNAEMGDSRLRCLRQYAYRTHKVFQMGLASQDSNKALLQHDSARLHASVKIQEAIMKFVLDSITASTLQPQSSIFRFPPIWSPEVCTLHYEVWDWRQCDLHSEILAAWARQGMLLTKHTHTCSSWAQHHRSGWRLCGKIRYGVKPSLFILCNFHKPAINFYCDKN